jgi:pyruvate-formate lyase-activating enzyme
MSESVVCEVCPRSCTLEDGGQAGFCGVRKNIDGRNVDRWYQVAIADFVKNGYRVSLPGCNLKCPFCGVPGFSRPTREQLTKYQVIDEEDLVSSVRANGRGLLYFLGGEPTLHYEYVLKAARLAYDQGIATMLGTSGYISEWLAEKLAKSIDLLILGIKGSASPELYRTKMGADSSVCLQTMRVFWSGSAFFDTTDLIGPGLETPDDDLRFARWVCENIDPDYPIWLLILSKKGEFYCTPERLVESYADARTRAIATLDRFESVRLKGLLYPSFARWLSK